MKKLTALTLAILMLAAAMLLTACEGTKTPDQTPEPSSSSSDPTSNEPGQSTDPSTNPDEPGQSTDPSTSNNPGQSSDPTTSGSGTTWEDNDGYTKPNGYLDVDFGGRTFTIVACDDPGFSSYGDFYVESRTGGTVIDTAVYDRNKIVESLYNCKIAVVPGSADDLFRNDVNSGTNEYDFGTRQGFIFGSNSSGCYVNAYDLDLNFNLPGWNKNFINSTTVRDKNGVNKLYSVDGDFNLISYACSWVIFCNLNLYNQNFTENIFDLVDRKEWTIDKMAEMIAVVAKDNGDSVWTPVEDTYGLMTTAHNAYGFITSLGIKLIDVDENFNYSTSADIILSNNAVDAIDKAANIYAMEGVNVGGYTIMGEAFVATKTLFLGQVLSYTYDVRDVEGLEMTMLPEPLYAADENAEYRTHVNNKSATFVISKNACGGDKEMMSDFVNVFVFHSGKITYPAFLKAYGGIFCSNERSMDMLDYILKGRQYDLSYYRGNVFGLVCDMMHTGKNSLSRATTKFTKELNAEINKLVDAMTASN